MSMYMYKHIHLYGHTWAGTSTHFTSQGCEKTEGYRLLSILVACDHHEPAWTTGDPSTSVDPMTLISCILTIIYHEKTTSWDADVAQAVFVQYVGWGDSSMFRHGAGTVDCGSQAWWITGSIYSWLIMVGNDGEWLLISLWIIILNIS